MEIKEIVNNLNHHKTVRIQYKEIVKLLEKNMTCLPFLKFRIKKLISKTKINIDENGVCIDALMNMIDFERGKILTENELKELEKSLSVHLFHISVVEEIIRVLEAHNKPIDVNLEDYVIEFYKKQLDLWLMYGGSKTRIQEYRSSEEIDLRYIKNKYKQYTIKR